MHRAGCLCMHMFVSSEDPDPSLLHLGGDLVLHSPTGLARHCHNPNLHTTPASGGDTEMILNHLHCVFLVISTVCCHFSLTIMFKAKKTKEGLYYNV